MAKLASGGQSPRHRRSTKVREFVVRRVRERRIVLGVNLWNPRGEAVINRERERGVAGMKKTMVTWREEGCLIGEAEEGERKRRKRAEG
jgi:hypothetical protein